MGRVVERPQITEKPVNETAAASRKFRSPNRRTRKGLSGIMTISATRYDVATQVPSVPLAPISPWIVGSAALTIEMSSSAMKDPIVPAATASQSRALAR